MIQRRKICMMGLLTFLFTIPALAQQFKYAAKLYPVDSNGFYSITISPQLSAYLRIDFADIRVAGENKQWIPHILQPTATEPTKNLFKPLPVVQNTITDSGKNLLIVKNIKTDGLDNAALVLKNSAVSRWASVSGSDNQRDWFIIDDSVAIDRSFETVKDEYLQQINFPPAKYQYLKIIINNNRQYPLQIAGAGFYTASVNKKPILYEDDPLPVFTQKDTGNYSYIEVRQKDPYHFDKISLQLSGIKFFNRDIEICLPGYGKNGSLQPGIPIANFNLSSASPATYNLPETKAAVFFIVIRNGDNPPLKIEKILLQQQTVSLVTYLQQGKKYALQFGDSTAVFADYDLQTFKDSIGLTDPLKYGDVYLIKKNSVTDMRRDKNRWIWLLVIIAGIMLSFLTYRLTRDLDKKNDV